MRRGPVPKARPKVKTNHPAPTGHPSSERRGIKAKTLRPAVVGTTSPARATVSLAPPPRRSGFSPISPRPTGQPTPAASRRDGVLPRCRVETRPTVPLRRRARRRSRTGWWLARLPELKPKPKGNHPTPPREGNKAEPVGGVCHQRRGITPPPRRGLGRYRAADYSPKSAHKPSTRVLTAASITIGVPHSRWVSPVHLLVASKPILPPSPDTGLAKSR